MFAEESATISLHAYNICTVFMLFVEEGYSLLIVFYGKMKRLISSLNLSSL